MPPSTNFGTDDVGADNQQKGFDHDLARRTSAAGNDA